MLTFKEFHDDKIPSIIISHNKQLKEGKRKPKDDDFDELNHKHLSQQTFPEDEQQHLSQYQENSHPLNVSLFAHHHTNIPHPTQATFQDSYGDKHDFNLDVLDKATTRHNIGKHMTVFSGVRRDPRETMSKSGHVHLPAYSSTTPFFDSANEFAIPRSSTSSTRHMLQIKLHPEDKGAYIGHDSDDSDYYGAEKELLLPRGITLKIHKSVPSDEDPNLMIHHASIDKVDPSRLERNPDIIKQKPSQLSVIRKHDWMHPDIKKLAE